MTGIEECIRAYMHWLGISKARCQTSVGPEGLLPGYGDTADSWIDNEAWAKKSKVVFPHDYTVTSWSRNRTPIYLRHSLTGACPSRTVSFARTSISVVLEVAIATKIVSPIVVIKQIVIE
jgi:hypothetical protein